MSRYNGRPHTTRLFIKRVARKAFGPAFNVREKLQQRQMRGRKLHIWLATSTGGDRRLTVLVHDRTLMPSMLRNGRFALPALCPNWKIGMRLFFRVLSRGTVMTSRSPTGAFNYGKLQSSRVKKANPDSPIRRRRWIAE